MQGMNGIHEECGVFGVMTKTEEACEITCNALLALQHRGQEGAGIAALKNSSILCEKDLGLVAEVFTPERIKRLPSSNAAIGHVRYSTTGNNTIANVQPIVKEYLEGRIAVAHNGNIVNAAQIRERLKYIGCDFVGTNDTEAVALLIAFEALRGGSVERAVEVAAQQLQGAFSLLVLSGKKQLIAVRDVHGFRPLVIGQNEDGVAVASESCALESAGFTFVRDVEPGEMIVIDADGRFNSYPIIKKADDREGLCIFEYVYFARPDSVIDGLSVYRARFNMGIELAKEYPVDADIVCGVPDSGLDSAAGYAWQSGIPYASGFVKNRYIGRSFIFPTQAERDTAVRLKLNPLEANVRGKRVVLVDDSIVRGTTSAKIIRSLKQAGAREVHLRVSAPPFRHTCHFGTDIDSEENLIANRMSIEDIRRTIGADSLGYISCHGLKEACRDSKRAFCMGCFTGEYPVEIENGQRKIQFEQ